MEQIYIAGRQLRWIVAVLLVLTPLIYIAVFYWQGPAELLPLPSNVTLHLDAAGPVGKGLMFLTGAMTPLIYWLVFYYLHDLAGVYSHGLVFSPGATRRLRRIGLLVLMTDFVYMFQVAITGPMLTVMGLAEGFLSIELKLGTSVIGLFILMVSRVMVLAAELEEQQRLTI